jgi:hypothetical protein
MVIHARGSFRARSPSSALGHVIIGKAMMSYLEAHRDGATWLVAVVGSSAAAEIILETGGIPVMAMGGFRGTCTTASSLRAPIRPDGRPVSAKSSGFASATAAIVTGGGTAR